MASTTQLTIASTRTRSALAVLAGFFTVVILSLGTDQVLHVLRVYPPWGEPMFAPGLNALALSYRIVFTVLGGFVTARLAPRSPMRHVTILAVIGLIAGLAGVAASLGAPNLGPTWYPIAIAVTGYPCTWLGGAIAVRHAQTSRRQSSRAG